MCSAVLTTETNKNIFSFHLYYPYLLQATLLKFLIKVYYTGGNSILKAPHFHIFGFLSQYDLCQLSVWYYFIFPYSLNEDIRYSWKSLFSYFGYNDFVIDVCRNRFVFPCKNTVTICPGSSGNFHRPICYIWLYYVEQPMLNLCKVC